MPATKISRKTASKTAATTYRTGTFTVTVANGSHSAAWTALMSASKS